MNVTFIHIKTGYMISIVIHGLLILSFLFIKLDWNITIPEFIEIHFEKGNPTVADLSSTSGKKIIRDLEIPKTVNIEQEYEVINIEKPTKLVPGEKIDVVNNLKNHKLSTEVNNKDWDDERQVANFTEDTKLTPAITADSGQSTDESPFEIEGISEKRTILMKVIPEYPKNYQQEAVVKIRFTVLPNGLIGEMIPVIRSNDLLERVALEAFKQWRFNSLPPDIPQVIEKGTIAFKYILH